MYKILMHALLTRSVRVADIRAKNSSQVKVPLTPVLGSVNWMVSVQFDSSPITPGWKPSSRSCGVKEAQPRNAKYRFMSWIMMSAH